MAVSTSRIRGIWPGNSGGAADRVALYSGYCSVRYVARETSNATARCVGCSSRSTLMSMAVKPYTAFVVCPVEVEKFSAGSAWKAR